jgi:hypothetical protein
MTIILFHILMIITLILVVAVRIHETADKLRIFLKNTTKITQQVKPRGFLRIFLTDDRTVFLH